MERVKIIDRFPHGTVKIPPSKSVSHRALICAALAGGTSRIVNLGDSEDIRATIGCLTALGGVIDTGGEDILVSGGLRPAGNVTLDCAESGSTLRFLLPLAAAAGVKARLTGRGRLMKRPQGEFIEALRQNGAEIEQTEEEILVHGKLTGSLFTLPGHISSQYVSGLLMALPLLGGGEIRLSSPLESSAYVDLTIGAMDAFGVRVERNVAAFTVPPGQKYTPCRYEIEGDYSQAAFFLVAGALGCETECLGLNPASLQGDRKILDILKRCSVKLETGPCGGIKARADKPRALTVNAGEIPDLVPPLAVLLAFCEGQSLIMNASRLRLKESDRLSAMASELGKLGAELECGSDYLKIRGAKSLRGGRVDAWGDHRIAMAMAVAAVRCENAVALTGFESVNKSYPRFWDDFSVGRKPLWAAHGAEK